MLFLLLKALFFIAAGALAMPVGLLPSILLFRDLANGVDSTPATKRSYAIVLWCGLLLAWIAGTIIVWGLFNSIG